MQVHTFFSGLKIFFSYMTKSWLFWLLIEAGNHNNKTRTLHVESTYTYPDQTSNLSTILRIAFLTSAKLSIKDVLLLDQFTWDVWYKTIKTVILDPFWQYFDPDSKVVFPEPTKPTTP